MRTRWLIVTTGKGASDIGHKTSIPRFEDGVQYCPPSDLQVRGALVCSVSRCLVPTNAPRGRKPMTLDMLTGVRAFHNGWYDVTMFFCLFKFTEIVQSTPCRATSPCGYDVV